MSPVRTCNVEAGLPTLDEARRLVIGEIKRAKREGIKVLKVIHGYPVHPPDRRHRRGHRCLPHQYGLGRCGKRAFLKACPSRASAEDVAKSEEQLVHISRTTDQAEFTLRDEANALTAFAFRNGFLEELHSGKPSPILSEPEYSRISDEEIDDRGVGKTRTDASNEARGSRPISSKRSSKLRPEEMLG